MHIDSKLVTQLLYPVVEPVFKIVSALLVFDKEKFLGGGKEGIAMVGMENPLMGTLIRRLQLQFLKAREVVIIS
jgi:hypothetical protein